MKTFYSPRSKLHSPKSFMSKGKIIESPEKPERAKILLSSVTKAGHTLIEAQQYDLHHIVAVHDEAYINFLQSVWNEWNAGENTNHEVIPNIHPGRNMNVLPQNPISASGYYQADTACPIGRETWNGAVAAANTAISGAEMILNSINAGNTAEFAYCLCRPPGHHAYSDQAGGFCFLNNCAIAAQYLLRHGLKKIAILDIDVHHGNGTQGIFYHRKDVFTVSLHGDPREYYPFFAGYSDETGTGIGTSFNLNYPMPKNTDDDNYLRKLETAVAKIKLYTPEVLIIALGLDTSIDDPLAFFSITGQGFTRIGEAIATLQVPTLFIQEGGYISPTLGDNLVNTLNGFENIR